MTRQGSLRLLGCAHSAGRLVFITSRDFALQTLPTNCTDRYLTVYSYPAQHRLSINLRVPTGLSKQEAACWIVIWYQAGGRGQRDLLFCERSELSIEPHTDTYINTVGSRFATVVLRRFTFTTLLEWNRALRLTVHHCRNSSVLSLLVPFLALFRWPRVSCFYILVQFWSWLWFFPPMT
jgi:hypothetical protein